MSTVEELVDVTVKLPRTVIERVDRRAKLHKSTRESEVADLVSSGLDADLTWQERFDRLSQMYRARLAREGKLNQTPEEIMEELRRIREEVASEYYPL